VLASTEAPLAFHPPTTVGHALSGITITGNTATLLVGVTLAAPVVILCCCSGDDVYERTEAGFKKRTSTGCW
jgi:hypothetical protein